MKRSRIANGRLFSTLGTNFFTTRGRLMALLILIANRNIIPNLILVLSSSIGVFVIIEISRCLIEKKSDASLNVS